MSLFELFLIAVGLSMDAFAVAVCKGLSMSKITLKKSLVVGLYFGIFQSAMPLIGYFLDASLPVLSPPMITGSLSSFWALLVST